jgi:predicted dehydrogenase
VGHSTRVHEQTLDLILDRTFRIPNWARARTEAERLNTAIKVGVVGLGKMGLLHAAIVNSLPDASVTSVCEKDVFLSAVAKAILPKGIAVYRDVRKMTTEEKPDAVFVTTPIDTHVTIINDLLKTESDLNVFVEKPLAVSREQARIACEAAKGSGGVHMVGFQKRFSPVFQKALELLKKTVDPPIFFRAYCLSSDVLREGRAWRSKKGSGGVLLDSASHLLDILLWFFGEPTSVTAVKKHVYSREVEDYVHAIFSFESGLLGHVDACWSASNYRLPEFFLEIHGNNGMLTVTDDFVKFAPGKQTGGNRGAQVYHRQSFPTSVPFLLTDPEYTLEDLAFVDAVRTRSTPETNFVEAAKVNALIGRILENAEHGEHKSR